MSIVSKSGYSFCFEQNGCDACLGDCCIGQSGYIWITPKEIDALAQYLRLSSDIFKKEYLIKVKYKYSLKEIQLDKDNYACVFFDLDKRMCKVYDVRPNQCKTFPFWDYYKQNPNKVFKECPAIISC